MILSQHYILIAALPRLTDQCDVCFRNCISWTPLDVAVSVGDGETVEHLLNQKVPVDTHDREKVNQVPHRLP